MIHLPLGLIVLLLVGLVIAWVLVIGQVAWTLTHPPRRGYAYAVSRGVPGDPSEAGFSFSACSCKVGEGREAVELPVWVVRGSRADGATVIVSHGWGDSRVVMLSRLGAIAREASRVIMYDMRGHGEAPGRCRLGVREVDDLVELIRWTRERCEGTAGALLVLYGFSLGASVSIAAAVREPGVAGVIAEAPYCLPETPARNVLRLRGLPAGWTLTLALRTLGVRFDRLEDIRTARFRPRTLVLHGDADVISPVADGEALAAALEGEIVRVPGGQHNALWSDPGSLEVATVAVERFLETCATGVPRGADRAR